MKNFDLNALYGPGIPVTVQYQINLKPWHVVGIAVAAMAAFYGVYVGIQRIMGLMAKSPRG